jgi:glycosyltransferase involved in cell wall biosynthesis
MIRARIGIVQRVLPHYRVPFFEMLNVALKSCDIELQVFYGQERPGTVPKTETGRWPWGIFSPNRYWVVQGRELVWQPWMANSRACDLMIVEHSSRLLINYVLQARRFLSCRHKLAYWGHGKNFQARRNCSLNESVKRHALKHCDWWFAYTDLSAEIVKKAGFPIERTTVVQNTIDTRELEGSLAAIGAESIELARVRLGLKGTRVGLFCGGMYPEKQLPFLVKACERIRELLPDFEVILVGNGPDSSIVEQACARNPWMHYVGAAFGKDRALYFALGDILMMPGLVGLAIIDSFAACLPMFTTNIPIHSPEIGYLRNGENGWMTEHSVEAYAQAIVHYFEDPALQSKLRDGCKQSAKIYTLENMVSNFTNGIKRCLALAG